MFHLSTMFDRQGCGFRINRHGMSAPFLVLLVRDVADMSRRRDQATSD